MITFRAIRLLGFGFIVVISCYAWVPMNDNHDYNHDAHHDDQHDNNCHYDDDEYDDAGVDGVDLLAISRRNL